MYYPRSHPLSKPYPLLVTLQASIICPGSKQLRYQIKGNKGMYTKYGLDVQEATLRKVDWKQGKPEDVTPVGKEGWGVEPEGAEGELELVKDDGTWEASKYVVGGLSNLLFPIPDTFVSIDYAGTPPQPANTRPSINLFMRPSDRTRAERPCWSSPKRPPWSSR